METGLPDPHDRNSPSPRPRGGLTFRQEERIRARAVFQNVYGTGQKFFGRFLVLFAVRNNLPRLRFGITVTKKSGSAVTRNRIRRQLREIFRTEFRGLLVSAGVSGLDIVVNVRPGATQQPFEVLRDDFLKLSPRLGGKRRSG